MFSTQLFSFTVHRHPLNLKSEVDSAKAQIILRGERPNKKTRIQSNFVGEGCECQILSYSEKIQHSTPNFLLWLCCLHMSICPTKHFISFDSNFESKSVYFANRYKEGFPAQMNQYSEAVRAISCGRASESGVKCKQRATLAGRYVSDTSADNQHGVGNTGPPQKTTQKNNSINKEKLKRI